MGKKHMFLLVSSVLLVGSSQAQVGMTGDTDVSVIATIGSASITDLSRTASLNDSGMVAFVGNISNGQSIFVGDGSGAPQNVTSSFVSGSRTFRDGVQINNSNQVSAVDRTILSGVVGYRARIWDADADNSWTIIAEGETPPSLFNLSFDALSSFTAMTNGSTPQSKDGTLTFQALNDTDWELYNSSSEVLDTFVRSPLAVHPTPQASRPMSADNGASVIQFVEASDATVVQLYGGESAEIARTGTTWSELGRSPGISDDGVVVTFYGNLTTAGAQQINNSQAGVNPVSAGPGIFASVQTPIGRRLLQVAGLSGNGVLDPGDSWNDTNGNGNVDANEDINGFTAFEATTRVGVNRSHGDTYRLAFLGTGTGNLRGLFTGRIEASETPMIKATATPVAQAGRTIPGLNGNLTDFAVYDPVNSSDQLAFWTSTAQADAIVRATRNVDPLRQFHSPFAQQLYAEEQLDGFIERLEMNATGINAADIDELDDLRGIRDRSAYNLARRGCLVSSYAMALKLLEDNDGAPLADLTPAELNQQLTQNAGYSDIDRIARDTNGTVIYGSGDLPVFIGADLQHGDLNNLFPSLANREVQGTAGNVLTEVRAALANGEPALLNVRNGRHWVIATGVDDANNVTIVDPGSSFRDGNYANLASIEATFGALRKARVLGVNDNPRAILQTESPIEVVITSPSGLRIGYDPVQDIVFNEIADSSYAEEFPIGDPDTSYTADQIAGIEPFVPHIAFLNSLESGFYSIEVFGVADGNFSVNFDVFGGATPQTFSESGTVTAGQSMMFNFEIALGNVPGDFNSDGVVDAADYTVWRDNLGAAAGTLANDTVGGAIGQAQYDLWRANYAATLKAVDSAESAPEPPLLALLTLVGVIATGRRASSSRLLERASLSLRAGGCIACCAGE